MERGLINYKWEAKKKVLKVVVPIISVIILIIVGIFVRNYIADKTGYHRVLEQNIPCNKCSNYRVEYKDVIMGDEKNIASNHQLVKMYHCRDCNYKWLASKQEEKTVKGIMSMFYSTTNEEINDEKNNLSYNDKHRMK